MTTRRKSADPGWGTGWMDPLSVRTDPPLHPTLRATAKAARDAGSCNFCHQPTRVVYEVRSVGGASTLVVRFCRECLDALHAQTRRGK